MTTKTRPQRAQLPCDIEGCSFEAEDSEDLDRHKAQDHRAKYQIRDIAFPVKLPGGYIDEKGNLHQEVELHPFEGTEEDLLADRNLQRDGEGMRRIIANCLVKVGSAFNIPFEGRTPKQKQEALRLVNELLIEDKTFLMIILRRISVRRGDIYRFATECPNDSCKFGPEDGRRPEVLDLRDFYVMPMPNPKERQFSFRLPKSGKIVRWRHLVTSDEPEILNLKKRYGDKFMSAQLWLQTLTIDGVRPNSPSDLQRLPASDRDDLRLDMDSKGGGFDLTVATECPRCKYVRRGPMELDPRPFFFPSLAKL